MRSVPPTVPDTAAASGPGLVRLENRASRGRSPGLAAGLAIGLSATLGLIAPALAEDAPTAAPAEPAQPASAAPAAPAAEAPAPEAPADPLAAHLPEFVKVRTKLCTAKPGQKVMGARADLCQALRDFEAGKAPTLPAKDSMAIGALWRFAGEDMQLLGALPVRMIPGSSGPQVVWFKLMPQNVQETSDTNKYLGTWKTGKPDDKGLTARLVRAQLGSEAQRATETPDRLKVNKTDTVLAVDATERGKLTSQLFLRQKGPKLTALLVTQEATGPVLHFSSLSAPVAVPAAAAAAAPAK